MAADPQTYTGAATFKSLTPLSITDFFVQDQFMGGALSKLADEKDTQVYTPTASEQQAARQHMSSLFNQ